MSRVWEEIVKCFKKGGKGKGCVVYADLYKRVPPNQRKQFQLFAKKNEEYKSRVTKYPGEMPAIDWNYYKTNVRKEYVDWVKEFKAKYENLDNMFSNRHTLIDHSKYFCELNKQTEEVKEEVKKYKAESEERIKKLQYKMDELKCMKPYNEMTMEEFCLAHPKEAPDFINKPTFWPHLPDEQKPGPVEEVHHDEDDTPPKPKSEDKKKPDPAKPPPTEGGGKGPDKKPPPTEAGAKDVEKKAEETKEKPAKETKEKPVKAEVKAVEGESTESKAVEAVSEMATKGIEIAKDLAAKAVVLLQGLWTKIGQKRKEVAASAEAAKLQNQKEMASKSSTAEDDDEDSFNRREGPSNICHKTIIKGEDTAKADVKPQHVDLDIESESPQEICKKKLAAERRNAGEDGEESPCRRKAEEDEEKKHDCGRLKEMLDDCCKEAEKKKCEVVAKPCEEMKKEKECEKKPPKCEPTDTLSVTPVVAVKETPVAGNIDITNAKAAAQKPKDSTKTETIDNNTIIGMHQECLTAEGEIFLGSKQGLDAAQEIKTKAKKVESTGPKDLEKISKGEQVKENKYEMQLAGTITAESTNKNFDDVAKLMFKTATEAAYLLADAKKVIEQARRDSSGNAEALISAYELANKQITKALAQAYEAISSAKTLSQSAQGVVETEKQNAIALIEKHATLAKLLANQAITMQKEIVKLLTGLKKKS